VRQAHSALFRTTFEASLSAYWVIWGSVDIHRRLGAS
jgi:hypothetical protein